MRAVTFTLAVALSAAVAAPRLFATPVASKSRPAAEAQTLGPGITYFLSLFTELSK